MFVLIFQCYCNSGRNSRNRQRRPHHHRVGYPKAAKENRRGVASRKANHQAKEKRIWSQNIDNRMDPSNSCASTGNMDVAIERTANLCMDVAILCRMAMPVESHTRSFSMRQRPTDFRPFQVMQRLQVFRIQQTMDSRLRTRSMYFPQFCSLWFHQQCKFHH